MNRSDLTRIHTATSEDVPRAIAAIVTAFIADPPARFAWPSAHDYLQNMPVATREFAGSCFEHGSAYVCADCSGAALWLPPGVEPDGEALEKMFRATAEPEHLEDLLATFEQMGQSHPREAHWYLPQIGVDPSAQGQGIGDALMQYALDRCDKEQALAYLEASKPQNIPFYQRHGFEVTGEIQIGAAPLVTPMVRKPRDTGCDSTLKKPGADSSGGCSLPNGETRYRAIPAADAPSATGARTRPPVDGGRSSR